MSSRRLGPIAAVLLLATVTACGFRPLYGPTADGRPETLEKLSAVSVGRIQDRTGQLVRNELLNRINPRGQPANPSVHLSVNVNESIQNLAVQRDETATRANLILQASFKLTDTDTSDLLFEGNVQSIASYNISTSADFATLSAETDARRRGASDLADEITARVAIFLAQR